MREFIYLSKNCGFYNALFYFFYKIKLWVYLRPFVQKRSFRKEKRLERIYNSLTVLNGETILVGETRLILKIANSILNKVVYIRPDSSDLSVFNQVMINEEYKCLVEIYSQLFTHNPKYIVDCGANIGLTSIYLNTFFPSASITAIEPFKENISQIKLNFQNCGLSNTTILEGGVWDKNTSLSINRTFRDGKEWAISLEEDVKSGLNDIVGFSLLDIINKIGFEVDILKIDVEGTEARLFSDNIYSQQFLSKVKCLSIEIHDEFNIRNKIYDALVRNNFFYFNTGELTIAINKSFL